jgi:rhodanese-related sulfurtransferase
MSGYSSRKLMKVQIIFLFTLIFSTGLFAQSSKKLVKQNESAQLKLKKEATTSRDPWNVKHVLTIEELGKELSSKKEKPVLLHVGFSFLYNQSHIPGTKYVGAARSEEGIKSIKAAVEHVKKNKDIVVYCGCCPWTDCPNIRPAYKTLKDMGYKNVKVLYIPDSFVKDWTKKGYPAVK